MIVYIDGLCPRCIRLGQFLRRLDSQHSLSIRSFRHDRSYEQYEISESELSARMYVIDSDLVRVYGGFKAVQAIARRVPALRPTLPILWVAEKLGCGEAFYDYLALNRKIIPDPRHCDDACSILRD